MVAAGIGFPFWIAFAWFYEFTPGGLKRESEINPAESITHHTGCKLDFAIIGVLAIAVGPVRGNPRFEKIVTFFAPNEPVG
ncbi:MAG TPA: hypothetical protein VFV58_03785 [Blastocatellia bacterium]|nr:hypothetical protein [Blastocatellia bacterium]